MMFVTMLAPTPGSTAAMCADVESAKAVLGKRAAASGDPRAAARTQDLQAPRVNDVQAPRNQDIQAPRDQEIQSPRGGSSAPRGAQSPRSPEFREAAALVKEAEAACNAGNTAVASEKARAAIARLQP
ncbi:MAG TPA: hypothetical protein VNC82_20145 [Candidatus Limnocylindria bacterium]|nr:hypothetical protein [Candidatus Limnocylindria bacterium]